jgi:hypothetical protein
MYPSLQPVIVFISHGAGAEIMSLTILTLLEKTLEIARCTYAKQNVLYVHKCWQERRQFLFLHVTHCQHIWPLP